MNILILIPSIKFAGTEKFVLNFLKTFADEFDRADIAFFREKDNEMFVKIEQYTNKIFKLPYYIKAPHRFLVEVKKLYKGSKYDIVYCHANHASTILYTFPLWNSTSKTRVYYHSHNSSGDHKILHAICKKIIINKCSKKYACSKEAAKYMFGKNPAYIINNCIDIECYKYNEEMRIRMRNKYNVNECLVVGHVGRFSEQKNHEYLIDIFLELKSLNLNSKLFLVGDGELKRKVILKVLQLNLEEDVIFINKTEHVELYYMLFDVFILPSRYEGLPFVGIEAQAAGLPCLLSDNISLEVKITPLVNFLSITEEPQKWAQKIMDIYSKNTRAEEDYSKMIESCGYGLSTLKFSYIESGGFC